MKKMGSNPTDKEVEDMIKEVDIDKNGTIEFEEFIVLMQTSLAAGAARGR